MSEPRTPFRLSRFFAMFDRESWAGYRTAFRAGAKARLSGAPMNYGRPDFQAAWFRGRNAMDEFLASGLTLEEVDVPPPYQPKPPVKRYEYLRPLRHRWGDYPPDCGCDNCVARRRKAERRAAKKIAKEKKDG